MPLRHLAKAVSAIGRTDSLGALLVRLGILRGTPHDPTDNVAFTIALIALAAKAARSDGAVTEDEVAAFRRIVEVPATEEANVRRLFDLAKQDVAGFETYARQVGHILRDAPKLRQDVLQGLFFIAAADGAFHKLEEAYLRRVAGLLGIGPAEYGWIRSHHVADVASPYELLGLAPDVEDAELKARHREIVREIHPDRLAGRGLSADFIAAAERRLAAVNDALDVIMAERGRRVAVRAAATPPNAERA